jgi:hypothetical protein
MKGEKAIEKTTDMFTTCSSARDNNGVSCSTSTGNVNAEPWHTNSTGNMDTNKKLTSSELN